MPSAEEIKLRFGVDTASLDKGTQALLAAQQRDASAMARIWDEAEAKKLGYFARTKEKAEGFFKDIGGFAKEALGFFGITAGLEAINKMTERAAAISRHASTTGFSAERLQRTEIAGQQIGLDPEQTDATLEKMNVEIGKAITGSREAQKNFAKWGISIDGKSNEQIFSEIADKMAAMKDPAEKAAMAVDLMGKTGKDLVPLLERGADAMAKMGDHGQILSEDDIKAIELLHQTITQIENAFEVTLGKIIGAIAWVAQKLGEWSTGPDVAGKAWGEEEFEAGQARENADRATEKSAEEIAELEKQAAEFKRKSDEQHQQYVEENIRLEEEHMRKAAEAQRDLDQKKAEAADLRRHIAENQERINSRNFEGPTIADLAGRNWSKRFAAQYGAGGRFDLGLGDGPFAGIAQEYERAKYNQMYDRTYGNIDAANEDKARMNAAQDFLISAGVATPAMQMDKLIAETQAMQQKLDNLAVTIKGTE